MKTLTLRDFTTITVNALEALKILNLFDEDYEDSQFKKVMKHFIGLVLLKTNPSLKYADFDSQVAAILFLFNLKTQPVLVADNTNKESPPP